MSFFYVRNENPGFDRINLPEFNPAPPVGRINWGYNARTTDPDAEVSQLWDFLGAAVANGLTAEDLLCTIAERRVLPLQMHNHKIGHMSGRFDPTRTSKVPLTKAQVARRVMPLQARAHKICHMSGRFDPTRTSKLELTHAQIARRVNFVSQARLPDNWDWGMEPYSRKELPSVVGHPFWPDTGLRLRGQLLSYCSCFLAALRPPVG
jgi:hypothetical protein